jgi:hypothetical protein
MEQSNRERIEEDLWNGGGSSGTVTIPKEASEGMLALFDFVSMYVPHGEKMMMDFITDVAVALDNFDPTPYAYSSDGRPMDRSEFSTSA